MPWHPGDLLDPAELNPSVVKTNVCPSRPWNGEIEAFSAGVGAGIALGAEQWGILHPMGDVQWDEENLIQNLSHGRLR